MRVDRVIGDLRKSIEQILKILDRRIDLNYNIDCVVVDVADTGEPGIEFTVTHNLGRVPIVYFYNISNAGFVHDSNRTEWTATQMTLKCSAPNSQLKMVVL